MFRGCQNKGFHMTFENGWTISVQWGRDNYCQVVEVTESSVTAKNAEIAVWHADGSDLALSVSGAGNWIDSNDVAKWIFDVSEMERPGGETL